MQFVTELADLPGAGTEICSKLYDLSGGVGRLAEVTDSVGQSVKVAPETDIETACFPKATPAPW